MKLLIATLMTLSTLAGSIEIMSYNVENLFDTVHDEGKNDWTFLPKKYPGKSAACKKVSSHYRRQECYTTDWTEEKMKIKFSQIKDVLLKERKKLPNILALSEIENENVISKLAKYLGYTKFFVSNSPDYRGIDLAILFNENSDFKFVGKREIVVNKKNHLKFLNKLSTKKVKSVSNDGYFKKRSTRNILEVELLIGGKYPLFLFVNHWPSLGNPDHARVSAATILKGRVDQVLKIKNASALAVGDFNTIPKLKKSGKVHPYRDVLLKDSPIRDLYTTFMNDKSISKKLKDAQPPGTYFYKRGNTWNHLDRVFFTTNLLDKKGMDIELASFHIYAPKFIRQHFEDHWDDDDGFGRNVKDKGIKNAPPFRYEHNARKKSKAGYSDHFPLVFNLKF